MENLPRRSVRACDGATGASWGLSFVGWLCNRLLAVTAQLGPAPPSSLRWCDGVLGELVTKRVCAAPDPRSVGVGTRSEGRWEEGGAAGDVRLRRCRGSGVGDPSWATSQD